MGKYKICFQIISDMETTIQHVITLTKQKEAKVSLWKKFISWTDRQEEYRMAWTAITILGHGCFFTIVTLITVIFSGNNFIFWPIAAAAMGIPLVANLAAMPTRITIPLLFFSVLIDLGVIISCIAIGDFTSIYR
jgi:hypothetical protein